MIKKQEVLDHLLTLGLSKKEVDTNLRRLGINSEQRIGCPISQYLYDLGLKPLHSISFLYKAVWVGGFWFPLRLYPRLNGVADFIVSC